MNRPTPKAPWLAPAAGPVPAAVSPPAVRPAGPPGPPVQQPGTVARPGAKPPRLAPPALPGSGWSALRRAPEEPAWVRRWSPPAGAYGPCPAGGTHLRIILDESGSVHGADPVRYRHALLRRVLRTLAPACTCGACRVSVALFGITDRRCGPVDGPHPWRDAGASLDELLRAVPGTGSYLQPPLDELRRGPRPAGAAATVCVTDLALFDADPARAVQQLASEPAPLLILVAGNGPAPAAPPAVTVVPVGGGSDRTAVADAVARHLTGLRAAAGTAGPAAAERPRRRRGLPAWLPVALIGLAALGLVPILGAAVERGGEEPPAEAGAPGQSAPDGFSIPGLHGSAPRTVPMQTTWVLDDALAADPAGLALIRDQLPAVVDYQRGYAIAGDTLALGAAPARPLTDRALPRESAAAVPTPDAAGTVRALLSAPPPAGADRSVAILTNDPDRWRPLLPAGTAADAVPAEPGGARGAVQAYVIDLGAPGDVPSRLSPAGPWQLPAGGGEPGGVAVPLARAWGHAIGAGWDG